MHTKPITLDTALFLGQGASKATYRHPHNNMLCIKISLKKQNNDIRDELRYRSALQKQNKTLSLITQYHGCINTNLGIGYIYDLVKDFDNNVSCDLKTIFDSPNMATDIYNTTHLDILKHLKNLWMEQCVAVSDVDFSNFLIQRISKTEYIIKIIDNIGSPVKIPLAYYFHYFASARAIRYWNRLIKAYISLYPDAKQIDEIKALQIL